MKNDQMNPKVSVIVPVYNPGPYLEQCLNSLLMQTYSNLEIILVDDGSTDGSGKMCDDYAAKDSRILCLHQRNSGVSSARNAGIERSSGEYVHFLDSDDYLELNAYEILMQHIEAEKCDVAVCEYFVDYPDKSIRHELDSSLYNVCSGEEAAARLFSGFQFACTKFFPRKLISDLRFHEDIYRGEDTLYAAEALLRAKRVCYLNMPLYHYVQSEESACRGRFRESQLSILKLYEEYECLYGRYSVHIPTSYWTFMHDNLIFLYYDVWSDQASFIDGERKLKRALKKYYICAAKSVIRSPQKAFKFFVASFFPDFFCVLHKRIHHL